jgi:hypothetical protein
MSNELVIFGAAYGRADVTWKIRSLRKDQKLFVKAITAFLATPGLERIKAS